MDNPKVNVEIMRIKTSASNAEIQEMVWTFIVTLKEISANTIITVKEHGNNKLKQHVSCITFCDALSLPIDINNVNFYIYRVHVSGPELETLNLDNDQTEEVPASNHWILPSADFHGLWESLIYEDGIKENILKFVETTMHFAAKSINTNVISCNRIILLHGPPGTGKTSLCKAIGQKLSIRLNKKYRYFHLIEINSHSLFSKWFSESGKLVMKLFSQIRELIECPSSMVCILIDEIESIAFSRDSISSNEPSDSLRVVNAVLTQLDQIRKYSNVLILTTSNLTSTIDFAFLDRADIKQYIGPPNVKAIYEIYCSIIQELFRVEIISPTANLFSYNSLEIMEKSSCIALKNSLNLLAIAKFSIGISGRTLRKIPILAHAYFTNRSDKVTIEEFLVAMRSAVEKYKNDKNHLAPSKLNNGISVGNDNC